MATDSDKPFQCIFEGCGQRFSNNDHLAVHRQKHEFSLKFGLANKTGGEALLVDQTPTPTRFLRNVEESGLFQELADNPFEQEFEKNKNGGEKQPPTGVSTSSAGVESQTSSSKTQSTEPASASASTSTNISSVTITSIPMAPPPSVANPDKPVPMATPPAHMSTTSALTKQKLLQNIQMKEQQKLIEAQLVNMASQPLTSPDILTALRAMQHQGGDNSGKESMGDSPPIFAAPTGVPDHISGKKRRGRKPDEEDPEIKRQRFLERNRAAASRCRAKKKLWVEDMEKRSKEMDNLNQALQQEVISLRSEVQQLKSILIAHKDCPLIVHQTVPTSSSANSQDGGGGRGGNSVGTEVTLLSQLSAMPSMSPLISSPVPSVGSVVPNISPAPRTLASTLNTSQTVPTPTSIIFTANGATSETTPEVAKDVEIGGEDIGEP